MIIHVSFSFLPEIPKLIEIGKWFSRLLLLALSHFQDGRVGLYTEADVVGVHVHADVHVHGDGLRLRVWVVGWGGRHCRLGLEHAEVEVRVADVVLRVLVEVGGVCWVRLVGWVRWVGDLWWGRVVGNVGEVGWVGVERWLVVRRWHRMFQTMRSFGL
jgi:hypothetical protein